MKQMTGAQTGRRKNISKIRISQIPERYRRNNA